MKYEKLKELCSKSKRYRVLGLCCAVPALIIVVLWCAAMISGATINRTFVTCSLMACIIVMVGSIIFGRLEHKQDQLITTYIEVKIMDVVTEYGISNSNFELIQENPVSYKIAFHNQMVDYEKLQAMLDEQINAMNKITGYVTRLKLI